MKPVTVYRLRVSNGTDSLVFDFHDILDLKQARRDINHTKQIMHENRKHAVEPKTMEIWKEQTCNLSVGEKMILTGINNNCVAEYQRHLIRSGQYNPDNDNSGMCECSACCRADGNGSKAF